jgi:hypothetical protein
MTGLEIVIAITELLVAILKIVPLIRHWWSDLI